MRYYIIVTTLSGVGYASIVTNLFHTVVQVLDSMVTVRIDVYDTRCDGVSYDPITHSRHKHTMVK